MSSKISNIYNLQDLDKQIKSQLKNANLDFSKTNAIYSDGISGSGLSAQLAQLINLENLSINLHKSNLEDTDVFELVNSLEKCQNLISLNIKLDTNHIGDEGASYLGNYLSKCSNLKYLNIDLWTNQINDQGLLSLSQGIQKCKNLRSLELTLCENGFGNKGAIDLVTSIQSCYNLKNLTIDFSLNSFAEQFGFGLGTALARLCYLTSLQLNLSNSQALDDTDCYDLCNLLAKNEHLIAINLELQNNNCWYVTKKQLEVKFKKMKKLIKLNFSF
ncbi:kinase domain protein (macronuclear) [Tetrahymena thermophila SB210]|uniref:Kinase domain protein n=1 Tax=Tetrahymena thermophila (strain SB210) TaxID=312017 RepID=I7LY23_TETTS|nr:kinase domain protein [Tetrahymena thermophila SB210]EAS07219.3 kinase domain protein [Tetrahymena thermophila SB210]|eukprot:XP_001027461.3 kinase domain protein [Tetrahymena thermophila SB210]